jgi:hypothetical protein
MHQDFKELLSALNAGRVRYLIVGGYAVSFHAEPRATKDLDILIGTDVENSKAIYAALAKFGGPIEGLSAKDFTEPDSFFRMGTPPVMVDIMPRISGVEFEGAWKRRDLIDVDALRDSIQGQQVERQQLTPPLMSAGDELDQVKKKGREEWLRLREQKGPLPTPEELRAKGREDWLKAETARDKEPKNLGKGIDDDLD